MRGSDATVATPTQESLTVKQEKEKFDGDRGRRLRMPRSKIRVASNNSVGLKMYLVPCSCGTTFAVSEHYDRQGTAWSRYLKCPSCGKRHDPKNRLLQLAYQRQGYWEVDGC